MALRLTGQADIITLKDSELVPGGDAETSYRVRLLGREQYKDVVRRHTKPVPNRRTHQMENITDWEAVGEDLLDLALDGWDGVLDGDAPAECSRVNKLKLDSARSAALLDRAGMNQIANVAEQKASSFRRPA